MSQDWKIYSKAIVGALVAALTALSTALEDGVVTQQEWVTVVLGLLTGLAVIWAVPNATPEEPLEAPETATGQTDEGSPADDTVEEQPDDLDLTDEDIVSEPQE